MLETTDTHSLPAAFKVLKLNSPQTQTQNHTQTQTIFIYKSTVGLAKAQLTPTTVGQLKARLQRLNRC